MKINIKPMSVNEAWQVEGVDSGATPNPAPPVQNVVTKDADGSLPF